MRAPAAALLALLLAGLAAPGLAQDTPAAQSQPPVAAVLTLDQERLFRESAAGRAVQEAIGAENEALAEENRRIEAELVAEEQALTDRRPSLSPEEFAALAEAFNEKVEGLRAAQDAKASALEQRLAEERQRFFQAAVPILAEIMQESGAMAILHKDAVLLSFDRIDITDEAIRRLDAALAEGAAPPADEAPASP